MNAACEDIIAGDVCGVQDVFPGAWQWKTSDVMMMKIFVLTNKSDRMSTKNTFIHSVFVCIRGNIKNMKYFYSIFDKLDFTLRVTQSSKNKCTV